jgi:outer membrane protein assembly factor BamB
LATSPAAAFTPTATIFGANNITSSALAGAGSALPDVHVLGRGLSGPDALVVAGADLFVEDGGSVDGVGGRVTKFNASTGAPAWDVAEHDDDPDSVAAAGGDLFVADGGGRVFELSSSTGALVKVWSGPSYKFNVPVAMAVDGADLFVANYKGNSVTELPI